MSSRPQNPTGAHALLLVTDYWILYAAARCRRDSSTHRARRSITYVRNTGSVDRPTKNHTARTVPVPVFVSRLLEADIAVRPADALVFAKAAAVDGCGGVRLDDPPRSARFRRR